MRSPTPYNQPNQPRPCRHGNYNPSLQQSSHSLLTTIIISPKFRPSRDNHHVAFLHRQFQFTMLNSLSLRRRGLSSDADMRRHSVAIDESATIQHEAATIAQGRASEQIPRNVSNFLSPAMAATHPSPSSAPRSISSTPRLSTSAVERPTSPLTQEQHSKHRRFSMMKFRNASDPQLSSRARLQAAQASEAPPPLPKRE